MPNSPIIFQGPQGIQTGQPDGTGLRTVASDGEHPDWSPDGTQVSYETQSTTLWTADADGAHARAVWRCTSPCIALQDSAWSPDGREIAFMTAETTDDTHTSRAAIVVLSLSAGTVRTVVEDTSGSRWLFAPRWSSDGTSIVFEEDTYGSTSLSENAPTRYRVGVVDLRGRAAATFVAAWRGPEIGPGAPAPDWSGELIVFVRHDNLFVVRPDGGGERQLTHTDGEHEHAIQPTFTPDGGAIVFTLVTGAFGNGEQPTAALVGVDGQGMRTLGTGTATHVRFRP